MAHPPVEGIANSSVLEASCLHLKDSSRIHLEDVFGGHGVKLQNICRVCPNTFHVAADSALVASGHLSSGFLSIATWPQEQVRLSGITLHSWSSSLLSSRPSYVVVDQVSIDYKPPVNNMHVVAAEERLNLRHCQICKPMSCPFLFENHVQSLSHSTLQQKSCNMPALLRSGIDKGPMNA